MLKLIKSLFAAKSGSSSAIYDMPAHKGFRVEVYFMRTYRTSHLIRATLAMHRKRRVIAAAHWREWSLCASAILRLASLRRLTLLHAKRAERRNAKRYAAALTAAYGQYAD